MPFAPTCSRNQADGTFPSIITVGGISDTTCGGNSESRKFLKILPAQRMVGGYLRLRVVRIPSEVFAKAAASPVSISRVAERTIHCLLLLKMLSRYRNRHSA